MDRKIYIPQSMALLAGVSVLVIGGLFGFFGLNENLENWPIGVSSSFRAPPV